MEVAAANLTKLRPTQQQKVFGTGLGAVLWGATAVLAHGTAVGQGKPAAASPLVKVIQIRQLSPAEAQQLIPVRLTGVVTDLSGYKNSFFFQDASGGISVDRTDSAEVHAGDRVEIVGTSGPGLFAPVVLASQVDPIGHGPPPAARRFTYPELFGGAEDSQWIEVEGIVHSVRIDQVDGHTVLLLRLDMGGGPLNVIVQDFTGIDIARLADSKLRLRGVAATDFNERRQFVGLDLYVPSPQFVEVLEAANSDPFAMSATPIASALQFGQGQHRIKIAGTTTYQVSGQGVYLQDGSDGIRVQALSKQVFGAGRRVEAVGFPVLGEYGPILQDALLRDLGPAAPVVPARVQARSVITQDGDFYQVPYNQQLVQLEGEVEENYVAAGRRILLLRDGGEVFEASLPLSADAPGSPDRRIQQMQNGSQLRITGICEVHADVDHNPISFSILPRTADDIVILRRASWWTKRHMLGLVALLAGLVAAVVLWVVVLRNRVRRQTQIIRESEERFRHLAEHDYLTGLPNRRTLEERIAACLARCAADGTIAIVFTVDIDHFKKINDNYGHLIGDECLKIAAARLRGTVRKIDVIARTGGEEFLLVVGSLTSPETAERIASEMLMLFRDPVALQGHEINLRVSIGAALYPIDAADSITLRKLSDQALYRAKEAGRNRVVFSGDGRSASHPPIHPPIQRS